MFSCLAISWAPACVTGFRIAPHNGACEHNACRGEEELQQVATEPCLGCVSSLYAPEYKDTNILMGISIYYVFTINIYYIYLFIYFLWWCYFHLGLFLRSAPGNILVVHWTQAS